jgi:glycerol-3-phosphate acyltransferase PlsY
VATLFGLVVGFAIVGGLHWAAAAVYAAVWLGLLVVTRYSSLAGISAALLAPVAAAGVGRFELAMLFLGFALLVVWKHRGNVERLLAGREPRVGESKADG